MESLILNLLDELNLYEANILVIDHLVNDTNAHLELMCALNSKYKTIANTQLLVLTQSRALINWFKATRSLRGNIHFALIDGVQTIDECKLNQQKNSHPSFKNKNQITVIHWQRHFYLYPENIKTYLSEIEASYYREIQPRIQHYKNATIMPLSPGKNQIGDFHNCFGGVLDSELGPIEASITETYFGNNNSIIWNKPNAAVLSKEAIPYIDESIVYLGAFHQHFGHFLLESTSRFWGIPQLKEVVNSCAYLSDFRPFRFNELVSLLGVSTQGLKKITSPVMFREVYVPEPAIKLHKYFTDRFKDIFSQLPQSTKTNKNVYLSRSNWRNGRTHGESIIEALLTELEFEVVFPDQLSFTELIARLRSASLVVAISGSTAHHAVFLTPHSKMIVLNRSAHVHPAQTMIAEALEIDTYYIDCYGSLFSNDWSSGPFLMTDSDPFRDWIREWFGSIPDSGSKVANRVLALSSYIGAIQNSQSEMSSLAVDHVALANLKVTS